MTLTIYIYYMNGTYASSHHHIIDSYINNGGLKHKL